MICPAWQAHYHGKKLNTTTKTRASTVHHDAHDVGNLVRRDTARATKMIMRQSMNQTAGSKRRCQHIGQAGVHETWRARLLQGHQADCQTKSLDARFMTPLPGQSQKDLGSNSHSNTIVFLMSSGAYITTLAVERSRKLFGTPTRAGETICKKPIANLMQSQS